ncbi:MAG: hypothetical protein ACPGU5_07360 [Lishizhenia sp.]
MKQLDKFEKFPLESKVWLYQTNRKLDATEKNFVEEELEKFTVQWAAHGKKLWATAALVNPFFIAVVVDESVTPPSGCSIDASVHFLKELGKELHVDFFTRMKITVVKDEQVVQIDFENLASQNENMLLFDPLVSSLDDLTNNWPLPLKESNFSTLV